MRLSPDWVAVLAVGSAIVGCSGDDAATGKPTKSSAASTTPVSTTAAPATPGSSAAQPQPVAGELARRVAEAKALAVRDRNADADKLVVERAEKVSWPDSAYGCPATERTYAPGPFEGYRIVLTHGKLTYTYTSAEDTKLAECLFLE